MRDTVYSYDRTEPIFTLITQIQAKTAPTYDHLAWSRPKLLLQVASVLGLGFQVLVQRGHRLVVSSERSGHHHVDRGGWSRSRWRKSRSSRRVGRERSGPEKGWWVQACACTRKVALLTPLLLICTGTDPERNGENVPFRVRHQRIVEVRGVEQRRGRNSRGSNFTTNARVDVSNT